MELQRRVRREAGRGRANRAYPKTPYCEVSLIA
jgi:hypothetical protein